MKSLSKTVAGQKGITLIEVSIALIIAAVVAAAAFVLFQQNQRRSDAQDGAAFMTQVLTETSAKIGRNGGYTGFNTDSLANSGIVSKEQGTYTAGTGTTPGTIAAKGANFYTTIAGSVTGTNAVITLAAKGKESCASMGAAALTNATSVTVGGTAVTTAAGVAAACGDASTIVATLAP